VHNPFFLQNTITLYFSDKFSSPPRLDNQNPCFIFSASKKMMS
jgi:hypothetical protein